MPYVNLPPGNSSLAFTDGGRPAVADRPGGRVWVSEHRAKMINGMTGNGTAGLINASPGEFISAPRGTRCPVDDRRWMPWVTHCHTCGAATEPE